MESTRHSGSMAAPCAPARAGPRWRRREQERGAERGRRDALALPACHTPSAAATAGEAGTGRPRMAACCPARGAGRGGTRLPPWGPHTHRRHAAPPTAPSAGPGPLPARLGHGGSGQRLAPALRDAGREHGGSPGCLLKQSRHIAHSTQHTAHGCVHTALEYVQCRTLHILSGLSVPMFGHCAQFFLMLRWNFNDQFLPLASCPLAGRHKAEPGPCSDRLLLDIYTHFIRSLLVVSSRT